ncbi:TPA: hypothetical protein ACX13R_001309 [Citrobacter amalonaticus]
MDSIVNIFKKFLALWGVILYIVFTIIPVLMDLPDVVQKITIPLGTTIFIGFTITFYINKVITSKTNYEIKELINNKFPNLISLDKIGIKKIEYRNDLDILGIDILGAEELHIAMNDGRNFLSVNAGDFAKRLTKSNKKTIIFLIDPESDAQSFLCKKNGKARDYYKSKINESISEIRSFAVKLPESSMLEIYLIPTILSQNIILTENCALVGIYRNAPGKSNHPPQFVYEKSGLDNEYTRVRIDLNSLTEMENTRKVEIQPQSQQ